MSERTRSGYRQEDADAVLRARNVALMALPKADEATNCRRILALADSLIATAQRVYSRDFEGEAIAAADDDLARVLAQHPRRRDRKTGDAG